MSRIGIVTLPLRLNYGGILQAYALQTVLERLGHQVSVIQIKHNGYSSPHGYKALFVYGKRALLKMLGISDIPVYAEKQLNEQWPVVSAHTKQFKEQHIHLKEVDSYDQLVPSDYDVLVVGSDQVWRPLYSNLYQCYLQFAEQWEVKRIAYAASFGTEEKEYDPEQIVKCNALIRRFDAVSVREDSGVSLCQEYFDIQAQHVLDPTLLLTKEDYIRIVEEKGTGQSDGNLFVYLLDETEEKEAMVNRVAKEKQLTPFSAKAKNDYNYAPVLDRVQPPVEEWIRGFMDAEFVVTDSFHGCVFSILFNKPFIVLGNTERGMSRFFSLLRLFELEGRLIADDENVKCLFQSIDWMSVNSKLNELREASIHFITHSISA